MRAGVVLSATLFAAALLLSSCFCNPMRYVKKKVPIPTGDGGSITIDEGKGVTITNEKGETLSVEEKGDDGEFHMTVSGESGETTVTGDEEGGSITGPGGEVATWGSSVDQATLDKIALPVYPGAKGISSADMSGVCTAGFETSESFEQVAEWYEGELGEGWQKSSFTGDGTKSANWMRDNGKMIITVMWDGDDQMTRFTLARNLDKSE